MTERKRLMPLLWAALCALGFTILAVLVTRDRSPLDSLDRFGKAGEDWADDHTVLVDVLRWIEILFGGVVDGCRHDRCWPWSCSPADTGARWSSRSCR